VVQFAAAFVQEPEEATQWHFHGVEGRFGTASPAIAVQEDRPLVATSFADVRLARAVVTFPPHSGGWEIDQAALIWPVNLNPLLAGDRLAILSDPLGITLHVAGTGIPSGPEDWTSYLVAPAGYLAASTAMGDRLVALYTLEDAPGSGNHSLRYTAGGV